MSAIHYKFSSSNDYKNVTFNGLSISVQDCKRAIMEKEKLKMTEVDLRLTNAQSLKDYKEDGDLVPKNSSLLVRRIPVGGIRSGDKAKVYIVRKNQSVADKKPASSYLTLDQLKRTDDLATANASEQDKIKAMIDQSTTEYDPSKYVKPPKAGSYQRHDPQSMAFVKCYKCNQSGHYATQCRLNKPIERPKSIRPATGIPRSHMIQVNKDAKGAMLTPDGHYVVPFIDKKGYEVGKKEKPPFLPDVDEGKDDEEEEPVPDELICLVCKEIMDDAVFIPCCGNSYCDECIRNALLESDDHECPTCHKKNISPDSLVANKFLRQAVNKFRNETGISRKKSKNAPVWPRPAAVETKAAPPAVKPTKVSYGPPKPTSSSPAPSTTSDYVVKAKSAQIYAAAGYTIKKATSTNQAIPSTPEETTSVKEEAPETPSETISSNSSAPGSDAKPNYESDIHPPGDSPEVTASAVRCLSLEGDSDEEAELRKVALRKYGCNISNAKDAISSSDAKVNTEVKISPLNMMVERPETESPPPPPPPVLSTENNETNPEADAVDVAVTCEKIDHVEEENADDVDAQDPLSPVNNSPPSLLDDLPDIVNPYPIHSQGISITLKNAPVVTNQAKTPVLSQAPVSVQSSSAPPVVDPPMHVMMPAQELSVRGISSQVLPPPRLSIPPPIMTHSGGIPISLAQSHTRIPPPSIMQSGTRPLNVPTSIPPPNLIGAGMRMLPPFPLPPGVLPPRLPFPPPGLPPPGFLSQNLPRHSVEAHINSAPPPPGTGTPPIIMTRRREDRRERNERSSSRSKRNTARDKSPPRSRRSKLAIMSDEFTREQKQRSQARRKKRRGRSKSRSASESSSSYSSSSRSSSRSSYSSSGSSSSSSYSSSRSSSRSRSASPVRKKKGGRHRKRTKSRSSSRSLSSPRKRRGKKTSKRRKDPAPSSGSRRRRSVEASSPRRRRYRRSRSRSRDRNKATKKRDVVIPGMPPQSVLDYERDLALYDYYKQKYEQDWLRNRISPPSPFKRFINYNPTKVPPPTNHHQQVQSSTHVIPIQPHVNPLYTQPPPPGDATPTEEDAGLYAFRAPSPPEYFVPRVPAPWDPPQFDGNLAERARILQEEEYYNGMQKKLHSDPNWNRMRPAGDSYDQRGHFEHRSRDRHVGERRHRGYSPSGDRGRSWERDADRYASRHRRSETEMARGYRDSRDRDYERSRRRGESQRDSRSSRQESSRTRKRPHEHTDETSSRLGSHRSRRRDRSAKNSISPDRKRSDEPYPPGEGDGTPVRDESRVEFMNESIKVKVINEKVKLKREKNNQKSLDVQTKESLKKSEKTRSVLQENERRVVKSRDATSRINVANTEPRPSQERSPTPTLDEDVDPMPLKHPPIQESGIASKNFSPEQHTRSEKEGRASKISEMHIVTKRSRQSAVNKAIRKSKVKGKLGRDDRKRLMGSEDNGPVSTGATVPIPASRWDSDGDAPHKKMKKSEQKSTKPFSPVAVKSRKIRIKKPGGSNKVSEPTKNTETEYRKDDGKQEENQKISNPAISTDSRRVVVSTSSKLTVDTTTSQTPTKSPRVLRQSTSTIDEATFEPDYNDDESEKALSNYAPSDIDGDDTKLQKSDNDVDHMSSQEMGEDIDKADKRYKSEMERKDSITEESEESHDKHKKRKKKKRRHKKHKHHVKEYDDEYGVESVSEENGSRSSISKTSGKKSAKHSDDWDFEKRKDHKHHEKSRKSHKRKHPDHDGRKRRSEKADDEDYSDEDGEQDRRKSGRSSTEKRRKVVEPDQDALSLDEEFYSLDEYRSPSPEEKRKRKKKQKHKRSKKESKEVKTVVSRIRLPK